MTDEKILICIPPNGSYIEILGHRIDGFESFEAFCEHLKKYAVLEETVKRQKVEIERLSDHFREVTKKIRTEAINEVAERLEKKLANNTDISAVGYQSVIGNIICLIKERAGGTE